MIRRFRSEDGEEVDAAQYHENMSFDETYSLLKWRPTSMTICFQAIVLGNPPVAIVHLNDWIVKAEDGRIGVFSDEHFTKNYTEVKDGSD